MGYVGLPLISKFLNSKKYNVIGIENDVKKINLLKKNTSYVSHISKDEIKNISKNSYILTNNYKYLEKVDFIIFTLPTPITKNRGPDMTFISSSLKQAKNILKNQLIVLESTVYPGATADYFLPVFKELNLSVGKIFFRIFS